MSKPTYIYHARILRVVDADTWDAEVDVGFSIRIKHRFRLKDFDAPETYRPKNEKELQHGLKATAYVKDLVEGKNVVLHTHKLGVYGRYEADLFINNQNLRNLLEENGFKKQDEY